MARTTTQLVAGILGGNWDQTTPLGPFIDSAAAIVSRVVTCASNKGVTLSDAELELIERWLAAWCYTKMDPLYTSRSTLDASGSFARAATDYLDMAKALDPSGCVNAVVNRQTAGAFWLGKRPSEQIPYTERY